MPPSARTSQRAAEAAVVAVEKFAKTGDGRAADLPKQFRYLTALASSDALLREVAKRTTGEIALACAEALHYKVHDAIEVALDAKQPIADAALLRFLRQHEADDLVQLDGIAVKLRRRFARTPFELVVPSLATLPVSMYDKRGLMEWYLDTTNPTIVAVQVLTRVEQLSRMAATFDALKRWEWLDHVHIALDDKVGSGLSFLADATRDPTAKAKLARLERIYAQHAATPDAAGKAKADLATQLERTDDAALLDAAARAPDGSSDNTKATARLRGEQIDVVYEFVTATNPHIKIGVELLANAAEAATPVGANKDAAQDPFVHARSSKAVFVRRYLLNTSREDRLIALVDDPTRTLIRSMIRRETSLVDLFAEEEREKAHPQLMRAEALRQWLYEDKDPDTLLFAAAGSAEGAKLGCQLVQREKGLDWVQRLHATQPNRTNLRRFLLNCNDPKATKFVRDQVLQEDPIEYEKGFDDVKQIPEVVRGAGARQRLDHAMNVERDENATFARLEQLSADERNAILAEPSELRSLFDHLRHKDITRAVYLLGPTIPQLLAMPLQPRRELLGYLRSRPNGEELVALTQPKLVAGARALFDHADPLAVFSTLKHATVLAQALENAPDLLHWIFEDTEPSYALAQLAREPARKLAGELMEARSTIYDGLPAYERLSAAGRRGFDGLAKEVTDTTSKREIAEYREGEAFDDAADRRAGKLDAARDLELFAAIEQLAANQPVDPASLLSLVRTAPARQQTELLERHPAQVNVLRQHLALGPQTVFADMLVGHLLAFEAAAEWLFAAEPPSNALAAIAAHQASRALARALDKNTDATRAWIAALPRGASLLARERAVLDEAHAHVANPAVLRALFHARFDIEVEDSFSLAETRKLWSVGARLPPAQLNQKVIQKFVKQDVDGAVGMWNRDSLAISNRPDAFTGSPDEAFNTDRELTAEQVKSFYGLDDAQLATASREQGWLAAVNGKYMVKTIPLTRQFENTVLHEIGHSIDTMLGEQTELIYGLGGWKRYGIDQFEQFAADMGALDEIAAADRPRIVDAWKQGLRANIAVDKLVAPDHPAVSKRYAHTALGREASERLPFDPNDRATTAHKGRVFLNRRGKLSSILERTWLTAPSKYALDGPAEYFAECYAEYYREYDGTPRTNDKKGGKLATWIKAWFDMNVDTIRLSPDHVRDPTPLKP